MKKNKGVSKPHHPSSKQIRTMLTTTVTGAENSYELSIAIKKTIY